VRTSTDRRGAFTLIELLVVIGIMVFLMALTALLLNTFSTKTTSGVDQVTGRLIMARQMARRDGVVTGIRFIQNPNTTVAVSSELQFIRQPDDVAVGIYAGWYKNPNVTPPQPNPRVAIIRVPVPASGTAPQLKGLIADGDSLELYNGGYVRRITTPQAGAVYPAGPGYPASPAAAVFKDDTQPAATQTSYTDWLVCVNTSAAELDLPDVSANPPLLYSPTNYRFIRQPQPMSGEASLVLDNVVVDFTTPKDSQGNCWNPSGGPLSTVPPSPSAPGTAEILFSPSGAVIGQAATQMTYVWVRRGQVDPVTGVVTPPNSQAKDYLGGTPRIVTIYRNGAIAQHPVSRVTDPYEFTRDGRNSGM
jgi:type II secretory pathway pseudopilin PulG